MAMTVSELQVVVGAETKQAEGALSALYISRKPRSNRGSADHD